MDFSHYLYSLQQQSGYLKSQLDMAESNNRLKQQYLSEYYAYNTKLQKLLKYSDTLQTTKRMVMLILDKRRDAIIENLEQRVESILAVVLPEERFKIKITYTPLRGSFNSEVYIGKYVNENENEIEWARPKGTNGEFIKQLISFSILASINILLQSNFLFMDEPFSSSDTINVGKLKPIFDLMLQQDLQLLFIEHKRELYENLDHNLIQLHKHRDSSAAGGYVEVRNVERVLVDDKTVSEGADEKT